MDETVMSAEEDLQQKETRQKRHYFYLSQLQDMARDLPVSVYHHFSLSLWSSVVMCIFRGVGFCVQSSEMDLFLL